MNYKAALAYFLWPLGDLTDEERRDATEDFNETIAAKVAIVQDEMTRSWIEFFDALTPRRFQ